MRAWEAGRAGERKSPWPARQSLECGRAFASAGRGRSRGNSELEAESHIAAQTERDDVPPEQISEADHMNSTGCAGLIDSRIREVKQAAAVGACECAAAAEGFPALHAHAGGHSLILDFGIRIVDCYGRMAYCAEVRMPSQ